MSHTLWLKIGEEVSLPGLLTCEEEKRLQDAFEPAWAKAAACLGLSVPLEPLLRFEGGVPFFNASVLTETVSHGSVVASSGANGEPSYESRRGLLRTLRLLRSQWRLEKFLSALSPTLPEGSAAIEESVALGLAVQLLLLRLPLRDEGSLARWLAAPESAPLAVRATLKKILVLQARRTRLSPVWNRLYDQNIPRNREESAAAPASLQTLWKGIPICPGTVEAELIRTGEGCGILLFRYARPDTVEQFERARGLLFCEGGALAHACCVAREQGIPCVSGLGKAFFSTAMSHQGRVRLDGASGMVELLSNS